MPSETPPVDKRALRRRLLAERQAMPDREERSAALEALLAGWLDARLETSVGAYWPIKGEFDPLPVLAAWRSAQPGRRVGLPVIDQSDRRLLFFEWFPGCRMEKDAYGIPEPKGTEQMEPPVILVPCVGFGPGGVRLGYGGGYYDRLLARPAQQPYALGICYGEGFVPWLVAEPHDIPLRGVLTDEGQAWGACGQVPARGS